jgi:hypothetical protein
MSNRQKHIDKIRKHCGLLQTEGHLEGLADGYVLVCDIEAKLIDLEQAIERHPTDCRGPINGDKHRRRSGRTKTI